MKINTILYFPSSLLIFIIIISRLAIYFLLNIQPNPGYIESHWQHLHLDQLNESLISSIYNLHSQPPFWNMTIGLAAKVCEADVACVLRLIHLMNISLTLFISLMLFYGFCFVGISNRKSLIAALIYIFLPSTIYYENYIFYPHFTAFLVMASVFFSYLYFLSRKMTHMLLAFIPCLLLTWTWGIFHPVFMIAILLVVWSGQKRTRVNFIVLLVFSTLMFLPLLKNQVTFGFFGASSWLGLNISQVAPEPGENCTFVDYYNTLPSIDHSGTTFNNVSMIPYSARCMEFALNSISRDFDIYIKGRIKRFIDSTRLTSSDYFYPPVGFDAYPRISGKHSPFFEDGTFNVRFILSIGVFLVNIFLFLALLVAPIVAPTPFRRIAFIAVIYFIVLVGLGHALNGGEQERFRHSIEAILYFLFVVSLLKYTVFKEFHHLIWQRLRSAFK